MKNALRPSLLCLTACVLLECSSFLFAQAPSKTETKIHTTVATAATSAPAPTLCTSAVNYGAMDTVTSRSSATTLASKSMWYQCAAAESMSARMYLQRTTLEIPFAKAEGEGSKGLGKYPSMSPITLPESKEITGPPLNPPLASRDTKSSSTLPTVGSTAR